MSTTPEEPATPERKPPSSSGPNGEGPDLSSPPSSVSASRPGRADRWVWAAVALVVGIALGLLVMGLLRPGGSSGSATPPIAGSATTLPSTPATTGSRGAATVMATAVVPAECFEVADDSRELVNLANQAAQAARDLDAAKLSDLVRQIGSAQQTLTSHADTCRSATATLGTVPTPSPTS